LLQADFSLHDYIEMHGQQNIKFNYCVYLYFPSYGQAEDDYVWSKHVADM